MARPQPSGDQLAAVRAGDEDALADLVDAWLPVVLAWCKRLGGPTVDAHDATQDILMLVMDKVDRVYSPEQFRPWLFGVTRRVLARHRRGAWVKRWVGDLFGRDTPDEANDPLRQAELSDTARRVHRALDRLPDAHREVLVLCDLEHRTDEEVAALLAVPVGTVKSRLRRDRAAFRSTATRMGLGPAVAAIEGGA
ncbi:MAG: sigma-70 family RNA polymerase sigma factor [Myxococcota bacterium]